MKNLIIVMLLISPMAFIACGQKENVPAKVKAAFEQKQAMLKEKREKRAKERAEKLAEKARKAAEMAQAAEEAKAQLDG